MKSKLILRVGGAGFIGSHRAFPEARTELEARGGRG